ncbi:hypothetical protein ACLMJK_007187 [Lecanora helva]
MSSAVIPDASRNALSVSKSKKQKKKKAGKNRANGNVIKSNGIETEGDHNLDNIDGDEQDSRTPTEPPSSPKKVDVEPSLLELDGDTKEVDGGSEPGDGLAAAEDQGWRRESSHVEDSAKPLSLPVNNSRETPTPRTHLEYSALCEERDAFREEVAEVRRRLKELQESQQSEIDAIQEELATTRSEKEQAEAQYRGLLGKVSTIRSQLGERLKADAEDLSRARSRIEDLEQQCSNLHEQNESRAAELAALADEGEQRSKELSSLRNRSTLSQQNWSKERDDLIQRENYAKEEFEAAKQAMQDWEILAMEERSIRESIAERVADLEEQASSHRQAHEQAASERDSQSLTIDGLQRALQEIQDARRRELRELVENSQVQLESVSSKLQEVESRAAEASSSLEKTKQELERALPFEKEVKEKNLLIGKLRHEAVILNDHLKKALRYLKKGKPEDTIDKQLVTNHFLHFIALERADPKKFQVLQIIASLLAWTEEQREQAGLARPGASNPNTRVPVSPWHRAPSTPALSTDFFSDGGTKKESLAELWSDFLEQEAQEGVKSPKSPPSSLGGSKPP